jgi:hypothetical protein
MKTQLMTFGAMMVFGLSAVACAESPEETTARTGSTVQELVTSKDAVSCNKSLSVEEIWAKGAKNPALRAPDPAQRAFDPAGGKLDLPQSDAEKAFGGINNAPTRGSDPGKRYFGELTPGSQSIVNAEAAKLFDPKGGDHLIVPSKAERAFDRNGVDRDLGITPQESVFERSPSGENRLKDREQKMFDPNQGKRTGEYQMPFWVAGAAGGFEFYIPGGGLGCDGGEVKAKLSAGNNIEVSIQYPTENGQPAVSLCKCAVDLKASVRGLKSGQAYSVTIVRDQLDTDGFLGREVKGATIVTAQ